MTRDDYDLLMSELDKIAEKVGRFPDSLQASVYKLLLNTLMGSVEDEVVKEELAADAEVEVTASSERSDVSDRRNYASEAIDYYAKYSLSKRNDMEFAAFVVYYFTLEAPDEVKVESVGESQYIDLCKITGRQLPKRPSGALNNAKNVRGYLKREGKGIYSLTDSGEHFVRHTLLKERE